MKHYNILLTEKELVELLTLLQESKVDEKSKRFKDQKSLLKQCVTSIKLKLNLKPVCN